MNHSPFTGSVTVKLRQDVPGEVCPGVWRAWPVYASRSGNGPNLLRGLTITDEVEARRVVEERLHGKYTGGVVFIVLPPGSRPVSSMSPSAPVPAWSEPRAADLGWLPRGRRKVRT